MKRYKIVGIIQESAEALTQKFETGAHLRNLNEAHKLLERYQNTFRIITAWIVEIIGDSEEVVWIECYIDEEGQMN